MQERIIGTALGIIIAVLVLVLVMYHFNLWCLTPWGTGCMQGMPGYSQPQTQAPAQQQTVGQAIQNIIDTSHLDSSGLMVS